ncbi:MAG TPA: glycosyltransferase family 1 protein [Thermomicrobiales bacterium]|nr:glycosyltransferase family 1 protein [Chloroflexota bacterium]HQZ88660.1 glycosyltransferase family 1 protein [Thermomicrobiales bacterium]
MRVGFIGHLLSFEPTYRQAGVSRYAEALVRELPAVDPTLDLVVFTGPDQPPEEREFPDGIDWRHSRLRTGQPVQRIAWEQTVGLTIGRRWRLDVIHAPVNVAPLITGVPRVVTVHDLAFHLFPEQYPGRKQRYLRTMTRLSVQRAARVIAVSEATRQDIIRLYDADPERVVTVPNGVGDEMRPLGADEVAAFRARQGLTGPTLLFLGTLQPRKNLETLLRAWARTAGETGWQLVVAGAAGWHHEPIFDLARELGIADAVRFVGFVPPEDLPLWHNAADAFVYPSLYEGFGLPLLEAMACGTPVVTSETPALREVVGNAGLIVGPRDVPALAQALLQLAREPELREELAARGLRRASEFSWRRTAAETAAVYRAAAGTTDNG